MVRSGMSGAEKNGLTSRRRSMISFRYIRIPAKATQHVQKDGGAKAQTPLVVCWKRGQIDRGGKSGTGTSMPKEGFSVKCRFPEARMHLRLADEEGHLKMKIFRNCWRT